MSPTVNDYRALRLLTFKVMVGYMDLTSFLQPAGASRRDGGSRMHVRDTTTDRWYWQREHILKNDFLASVSVSNDCRGQLIGSARSYL